MKASCTAFPKRVAFFGVGAASCGVSSPLLLLLLLLLFVVVVVLLFVSMAVSVKEVTCLVCCCCCCDSFSDTGADGTFCLVLIALALVPMSPTLVGLVVRVEYSGRGGVGTHRFLNPVTKDVNSCLSVLGCGGF